MRLVGVKVSCCIHQDGFYVDLHDYPENTLREWSGGKIFCPICGSPLIYRHGKKNTAHFAHASVCSYPYYEPETEEHKEGKQLIKKWLEALFPNNMTFMEYYIKEAKQRADVMTIFPDGHRLCIELQCSPIPAEVWRKRYSEYRKANIAQVWFIGSSLVKPARPNSNKIKMGHFLKEFCNEQAKQIFMLSVKEKRLVYLSNLTPNKRYKTIYTYTDKWEQPLLQSRISRDGKINTDKAEKAFVQKKYRLEELNHDLVERMKPWLLSEVQSHHKQRYQEKMARHPVYSELSSIYKINLQSISPVFDQQIEGDQIFTLDHRLWQAYLFFTEILYSYRQNSRYDSGLIKPQIYISSIIRKKKRRPDRLFRRMIVPYINYSLLRAKSISPQTFDAILYPHELIYEYLDRLSALGFLRNTTNRSARNTSGGKFYGRFEVQFDRYYPELFRTEDGIHQFFQTHQLVYRYKFWYDLRSRKIFH